MEWKLRRADIEDTWNELPSTRKRSSRILLIPYTGPRRSMDSWALETGSPHPPLTPGKLRLYSMRFCPYAQRTLLVLKAKAIDHEVVNVNLRERPEWYYDVLPAGTVPVLYQDDKVISGSMPIIEYVEEVYPEPALMPCDPYLKALDRSFLDSALQCATMIVSIMMKRGSREEHWADVVQKMKSFEKELGKRKTTYFSGSPHPPLTPGKLRLYSMRFCPYAQRALLVLKAKSIDHEVVNVDLGKRPEWYHDVLPAGTVPVMYQDDKVISGSMPIIEYLEEVYPKPALMPSDPYLKALDRSFLDSASSCAPMIVSILKNLGPKEEHWAKAVQKMQGFEKELAKRKTAYFSGVQPGVVDYALWPTISGALALSVVYPELKMPSSDTMPLFSRWVRLMLEHPVVKAVVNQDHNLQFIRLFVTGEEDVNMGLK
ncbi:glutathione transferase omega-1-like isoform X2 [Haemaphysalis longicornis]